MARPKTMIEGFWERFEDCMYETSITKVDIAKKLGCHRHLLINGFEGRTPNSKVVMQFCAEYGFSLGYLCGISREKDGNATSKDVVDGFWDRFDECMTEADSKQAIAKRIGCNRKTVYNPKTEDGRIPSLLYIARFCTTYHYSPEYLVGTSKNKRMAAA